MESNLAGLRSDESSAFTVSGDGRDMRSSDPIFTKDCDIIGLIAPTIDDECNARSSNLALSEDMRCEVS